MYPLSPFFDETRMMHGSDWAGEFCHGWAVTEKYHGVRAYWDGHTLWTRGGHPVALPDSWCAALPTGLHLDGEIWAGYHATAFAEAVDAAKHGRFTPTMQFRFFDIQSPRPGFLDGTWHGRMAIACRFLSALVSGPVQPVQGVNSRLLSLQHLADAFVAVRARGGEGLVLRDPAAPYQTGRTRSLLKFKAEHYRQLIAEFPHLTFGA
jgi:DNA ligase-1